MQFFYFNQKTNFTSYIISLNNLFNMLTYHISQSYVCILKSRFLICESIQFSSFASAKYVVRNQNLAKIRIH